jgi:hypothetical protein
MSASKKGRCLPEAVQALYTALVKLKDTAEKVERHLIVHPYQRELLASIHMAEKAIEQAETGNVA